MALAALLGLVVVLGVLYGTGPREPAYQGKRLSQWLEVSDRDQEAREQATTAVRAIGREALPTLLNMIGRKDSWLKRRLLAWDQQRDSSRLGLAGAARDRRLAAAGFQMLGPAAKPAFPELARLFQDPELAQTVGWAILTVGPEAIAVLRGGLLNSNVAIRYASASALSSAGTNGAVAVPDLIRALKDPHYAVRAAAAGALGRLHCEPARVVPTLAASLKDPDPIVRRVAVTALGEFGREASASVPALRQFLTSTDPTDVCWQGETRKALENIEPPPLRKSGGN
jgi:hypothetical protein